MVLVVVVVVVVVLVVLLVGVVMFIVVIVVVVVAVVVVVVMVVVVAVVVVVVLEVIVVKNKVINCFICMTITFYSIAKAYLFQLTYYTNQLKVTLLFLDNNKVSCIIIQEEMNFITSLFT